MTTKLGSTTWLSLVATLMLSASVTSSTRAEESGSQSSALPSTATPPVTPEYYQQPDGFGGRKWGDALLSFDRLNVQPVGVDASFTDGGDVSPHFRCVQVGTEPCDLTATIARMPLRNPHAYILVSQHRVDNQGFRMAGVTLHPVTHFFCARWREFLEKAPPNVANDMRYCGIRLEFESENIEQLATLPADHVTPYQHVLRHMVRTHGRPYAYKGQVHVESVDDKTREARREFPRRYRWCTDYDSIFAPKCNVKISLTFDVETGKGSILMAAPLLHQFAASQRGESQGKRGPLYHEIFTDQ
jgi:hypothetical protein